MKKLAIVGSGSETRDGAPWDDPDFDIWVFNEAGNHKWCKRWDAVFQMHKPVVYTGVNTKDPTHWEWLQQKHGKPIYMQEVDPLVPDSIRFPLEEAQALTGLNYFASSFAYMAALAILLQKYDQVHIYGIELSFSEYQYQADCWRYWIGVLKGHFGGKSVVLHSGLKLFDAPLYGYEGSFAFGSEYFKERAKLLDGQWTAGDRNLHNIQKAIGKAVEKNEYEKTQELTMQLQTAAIATGELAGALAEAERYQTFGDAFADRGGFEYAAAKAQRDGEAAKPYVWHFSGQIEYVWNGWKQTGDPKFGNQMLGLIGKMSQQAYDMGALLGVYKENISYILKYDAMVQANGGIKQEVTKEMVAV